MEQNKKFSLSHVALYAKKWYERTGDIWSDLIQMLELDGYTPFHKEDVIKIIINRYSESIFNGDLCQLLEDISERRCWTVGYIHKSSAFNTDGKYTNEYDYKEAIIRKILTDICHTEGSKIVIKKPIYNETRPMPPHITEESVNQMFSLT